MGRFARFLILLVCLPIAFCGLVLGPFTVYLDFELARSGRITKGQVLDLSPVMSKTGQRFYLAKVRYSAGGTVYDHLVTDPIYNPASSPGKEVAVRYSRLWPRWAVTAADYPEPRLGPVITKLAFCIVFGLGASVASIRTLRDLGRTARLATPPIQG